MDVSLLGPISPTAKMLPSPQDSPHIISYALLSGLLFIHIPRPTPYCLSVTLWLIPKEHRGLVLAFQVICKAKKPGSMIDIWIIFGFLIFVCGLALNWVYQHNTAVWLSTLGPFFIQKVNTEAELASKHMGCSWQPAPCSTGRDKVLHGQTLSNLDFFFYSCVFGTYYCVFWARVQQQSLQGERQKYLQHTASWAVTYSAFSAWLLCSRYTTP